MSALRIETERLSLVPFSEEFAALVVTDRSRAAKLIGAGLPDDWPHHDLVEFLPLYVEWLRADATRPGFGPWAFIERASSTVVGSVGFIGRPRDGAVEIGFDTASEFRGRGYATEAARALADWGLALEEVSHVVARCDPENAASIRVLEKIGMEITERPPGEQLRWELRPV